MGKMDTTLCIPLQRLKDEHVILRKDMNFFYEITEEIEYEDGQKVISLFKKLYERISAFTIELKAHSSREEEALFPLMIRHLGENDRTIETMEFEHEKAERHLHEFLSEAQEKGSSIDETSAQWIAVYAVQAYTTLIQHFSKEESVLFPLAERILSDNEKEELGQLLQVH
jgi:regulator of cell morphogenesis and NO signaling